MGIGPPVWVAVWVADSWAHGVAFFVDQMVFGRGRWRQRFVWEERLGTTSVRNFNTMKGAPNVVYEFGSDYLRAGRPGRAARVVCDSKILPRAT